MLHFQTFWHPNPSINSKGNRISFVDGDGDEVFLGEPDEKDLFDLENKIHFNVSVFKNHPLKTLVCKKCRTSNFCIGVDGYSPQYTVIKCVNCHWEWLLNEL